MWVRRRPVLAASGLVLAVGAAVAGVVFTTLWREAQQRTFEARVAATRLEAETQWKQEAGPRFLAVLGGQWAKVKKQGNVNEAFATLWATEWIFGPEFLADMETIDQTRQERLNLLHLIYGETLKEQGPASVHALVYGSATAFWALTLDQPADARTVLATFAPEWRSRLAEGDRCRTMLDILSLCADVAANDLDPATTTERIERLIALRNTLDGEPDGRPLRQLIDRLTSPTHAGAAPGQPAG